MENVGAYRIRPFLPRGRMRYAPTTEIVINKIN
jgi:hypothetical protein